VQNSEQMMSQQSLQLLVSINVSKKKYVLSSDE
jgi:hypothetical protein